MARGGGGRAGRNCENNTNGLEVFSYVVGALRVVG